MGLLAPARRTHRGRGLVAAARYYADEPAAFVRDVLGAQPDDWQADALAALARGRYVAVRSGHGVGKSALAAWTVLWFLATRPAPVVPCTAPTGHQLSDILWAELARWLAGSPLAAEFVWSPTSVRHRAYGERWFAAARTSNKADNLAGFHARHLLYVVDEAAGVPEAVFQVIDGALTTAASAGERALVLLLGNPTKQAGYFLEAFTSKRWLWHALRVNAEDSPRVDPAWCAMMARKWGRDSDVYRVRVQGDPPRAEADTFIPLDLVERALLPLAPTDGSDVRTATAGDLCVGVDVARYGDSETAVVSRRGRHMVALECARKRDTQHVAGMALAAARALLDRFAPGGPVTIVVDDTGVGGGVTDALRAAIPEREVRIDVVPFNFASGGDERYADAPSWLWGAVRERLTNVEDDGLPALTLLPDDDLQGQLTTRKYRLTAAAKFHLETKEEMRKRDLPSPDRADALALACLPLAREGRHWQEEGAEAAAMAFLRGGRVYG